MRCLVDSSEPGKHCKERESAFGAQFKFRCFSSWLSLVKPKHKRCFFSSSFFLILIVISTKFVFLLVSGLSTPDNSYCYFNSQSESRRKNSLIPAISIFKQANLHRFQGLAIILCDLRLLLLTPGLHPLTIALPSRPWALPSESSCFYFEWNTCLQLSSFISLFVLVKFWEPHSLL